jgi:hypothetical protein
MENLSFLVDFPIKASIYIMDVPACLMTPAGSSRYRRIVHVHGCWDVVQAGTWGMLTFMGLEGDVWTFWIWPYLTPMSLG